MEMLFSGRFVSAEEALEFGLVNRVVAPEKLHSETRDWAMELAQASPYVLALGKKAFYSQVDLDEKSAYEYAKEVIAMNCLAEDAFEGMSAFLEKRKPEWKKRAEGRMIGKAPWEGGAAQGYSELVRGRERLHFRWGYPYSIQL